MTALGIFAFFAALLLSVTLHEAGHFLTARRYGMKATQFFVGFGPTLWSRRSGETEYGVKAVPLGGFVKIVGMTPLEEVEPGDEGRAFFRHRPWPKFVVLVAGSTMHFIICTVLIFVAVATIGVAAPDAPRLVGATACVDTHLTKAEIDDKAYSTKQVDGQCPSGMVPGPAKAAGVKEGDTITAIGGVAIDSYLDFAKYVRARAGEPVSITVRHADGQSQTLTLTPVASKRPDLDDEKKEVTVGAIGVVHDVNVVKDVGLLAAFPETGRQIGNLAEGTWTTLTKKLGTITGIYGDDRDPAGFVGLVGAGRITGEVFSADIPFSYTLLNFLFIVASLNLFVGVFNLLPLLPLDGGHIAVVWFEAVRDRIKRARGYAGEVVRVDYNKLMPVTMAVIALFVGFTVWILGADIVNPIKLGG